MDRTVLVAGASGALGSHVVAALRARGNRVRVLTRDRSRATRLGGDVEVVQGDALDANALKGACDGVSAVISSLGASVLPFPDRGWATFSRVDTPANVNLVREAERAGVDRFVYVSVFGADRMRGLDYIDAHERVVDALRESGLSSVIVRPTGFFSAFDSFVDMARRGNVYGFGSGSAQSNPIADVDLAIVCVDALDGAPGEREVGGPEVLTRKRICELAFEAVGRTGRIRGMPLVVARAMSWLARPFLPRVAHLMAFFAAIAERDLVAPVAGTRRIGEHFRTRIVPASKLAGDP
jgi:uncharacterized protein YbjT (DUF2867 family)